MSHNVIEPNVIDEELLLRAVNEQNIGEAAEIARKEGINYQEVNSLRLDYKNILKIENLWQFDSLSKLQLDNNIIEKIENLDHLVNLTWLDLSFNNITKIENLGCLTKLTDLSLFNNRVTKLENMDKLVNLSVLSIGNNLISEISELGYLAHFERLRLLDVAGNPLCKENPNYKSYILARMKNLRYLDYRLVDQTAVTEARNQYIDEIIALEEEASLAAKLKHENQRIEVEEQRHTAAFLPGITMLLRASIADLDWQALQLIAPEALADMQTRNFQVRSPLVQELCVWAFGQRKLRDTELSMYREAVFATASQADNQVNALIKDHRKQMKYELSAFGVSVNGSEGITTAVCGLRENVRVLSDALLEIEINFVDVFDDLYKEFERNYLDICNGMREYVAAWVARVRELQNEYHERVTEVVMSAFDRMAKADMDDLSEALRDLLRDKETVVNHLAGTHDFQLQRIDGHEEQFVTCMTKHQEMLLQKLQRDENRRSRHRIKEILTYTSRCMTEIEATEESTM